MEFESFAQLRGHPLLSDRIKQVLNQSSQITTDEIDVTSFLVAAAQVGDGSRGHDMASAWARALKSRPQPGPVPAIIGQWKHAPSPGLRGAFVDAFQIRELTGGHDDFIGLRHVFAAFATAARGSAARAEFSDAIKRLRVRRESFLKVVGGVIAARPEPGEDMKAWQRIMPGGFALAGDGKVGPRSGEAVLQGVAELTATLEPPTVEATSQVGARPDLASPSSKPQSALDLRPAIALAHADDAWDVAIRDRAGATREAEALAMLAAAKSIRPPIAVGIFGEWGSGKSFFLRLLHQAVESISGPTAPQPSPFHNGIVQIRFSAWHYVETNLWASLVDHIFTCLNRWGEDPSRGNSLLNRLATSRQLTLDAARELVARRLEQQAAAQSLAKAEAAVQKARQDAPTSPKVIAKAAWDKLKGTAKEESKLRKQLSTAGKTIGVTLPVDDAYELARSLARLDRGIRATGRVPGALGRAVISFAALGTAATVFLCSAPLYQYLLEKFGLSYAAGVALAGAAVTAMAGALKVANEIVLSATKIISRTGQALAALEATATEEALAIQAGAAEELACKEAAVAEAQGRFSLATQRLSEASEAYASGSGRTRLFDFIRERAHSDAYTRHLSFVAAIRRDFEELSNLMSTMEAEDDELSAGTAKHANEMEAFLEGDGASLSEEEKEALLATAPAERNAQKTFSRIILYIDDLDRCPAGKVVEVLQAIHLLLAFPLFVVFVAVDVRWLRGALGQELHGLIREGKGDANTADAYDYLEKIFQIPYWVRPFDARGTAAFLGDRLEVGDLHGLNVDGPSDGAGSPTERSVQNDDASPFSDGDIDPEFWSTRPDEASVGLDQTAIALAITAAEVTFMKEISRQLVASPRRLLRFVNTYRLVKASLAPRERRDLEEQGYRAALTLLAIAIMHDDAMPDVKRRVEGWPDDRSAQRDLGREPHSPIVELLMHFYWDAGGYGSKQLSAYFPLIERFSFVDRS